MVTSAALPALQAFRSLLYGCCTGRHDALFELVMRAVDHRQRPVAGVPELGADPPARLGQHLCRVGDRPGGCLGAANLLARHQLAGGQPIYAVHVSIWPRWDAEASPERSFYHHPSRHSAGQPIVAGWAYQWIAQLELARNRWTAPFDARRLHPRDNANQVAITPGPHAGGATARRSGAAVCLRRRLRPRPARPGLAGTGAAILVRLRAGRCFYADPPPAPPGRIGRPAATAPSSTPTTRPAGRRRPQCTSATTARSAPSWWPRGRGCIPSSSCTRPAGPSDPTNGARHPDPCAGQPHPGADASTQGAMAVVAGLRRARPGGAVAGTGAASTSSTPFASVSRRLAGPLQGFGIRAGRPLDLAGLGRLHLAPPRPSQHHRPAAAMGTAPAQHSADAGSGPPRASAITLRVGFAGQHAETLRAFTRSAPGQPCRACQAVSGDQENPVTTTTTPRAPTTTTAALPGTRRVESQA
jgi:hypothetical protein